jgi:hypothetical protein
VRNYHGDDDERHQSQSVDGEQHSRQQHPGERKPEHRDTDMAPMPWRPRVRARPRQVRQRDPAGHPAAMSTGSGHHAGAEL